MDAGVPKTAWKRLEDFIQRAYNTQFIASYLDYTYDASSANASLRILGTIHRFTAPTPESGKEGCAREAFMRAALHKILNEAQVHRARLPQLRALAATYSQTSTLTPIDELFPELKAGLHQHHNGHVQQPSAEQPRLTASSFGSTWKSTPNTPTAAWGQEATPTYQQQQHQQPFQQHPQQQHHQEFTNNQWGSHPNHQAPMYTGPPTQFQLDAPPPSAVERLQAFILDLYGEQSDLFDQIIYTQDRPTGLRLLEREYVATAVYGDKGIDREAATRSALQQGALSHILAQRAPGNVQLHSAAVDIIPSWSDISSLPPLPPPQQGAGMPSWTPGYPVPQSPYHSNGYSTPIAVVPMPPTSPYHALGYVPAPWASNDESRERRERSSSKRRERSSSRRRSRSVSKRHRSRSRSRRRHRSASSEDESMSDKEIEKGEAVEEGEERERRSRRHRSRSKSSKKRSESRSSRRRSHRSRSRSRSRRRAESTERERDRGRSRSRRRSVSMSRIQSRRTSRERAENQERAEDREEEGASMNGVAVYGKHHHHHQDGSADKTEPVAVPAEVSPLALGVHLSPLLDYLLDAMDKKSGSSDSTPSAVTDSTSSILGTLSSGEREKIEMIRQACELSSVMHRIRAAVEMNEIGPRWAKQSHYRGM